MIGERMMRKKIFILILLLGVVFINIAGCDTLATSKERSQKIIVELCDQKSSFNEIILTEYKRDDLLEIRKLGTSLVDVDKSFTIECLRMIDEKYMYSILTTKERGVLILLFENVKNEYFINDYWYMEKILLKEDFNQIVLGVKYPDVKQIDSYGDTTSFYTSDVNIKPWSLHQTFDGYTVQISYEVAENYNDYVVASIEFVESNENTVYSKMLSIDMSSIKKYME